MTREHYAKMTEPFRRDPRLAQLLHILNKIFVLLTAAAYLGILCLELVSGNPSLLRSILVPLAGFISLSIFRWGINRRRPYEVFEMEPVIPKDTSGKSFPSRHVFSAFIISMTFLILTGPFWMGVILLVFAVGIAVIRVISGVHFISDVAAGALWGILTGMIGYIIL